VICNGTCRTGDCSCQSARDGEIVLPSYCWDGALCECPPTHKHEATGLPCISVAVNAQEGTDRCLGCGSVWTHREYRWEPAQLLLRVA
jgi:hypothetical protein